MIPNAENAHAALMASLHGRHSMLVDLIGGRSFHYVDPPVHGNIGDLLIMHGTFAFFERHHLTPRIVAPFFAYRPEWIGRDEVVVFHGGGNFGDLYYGMHQLRERVAAMKPGNRIIILPQSIHFSSPQEKARSARVFRTHPDLHICVRDRVSYDTALAFSDHVYLLPDMAHQLYPIAAPHRSPAAGGLLISRTDDEHSPGRAVADFGVSRVMDWPQLVGARERNFRRFYLAMRAMHRVRLGRPANRVFTGFWKSYSGRLVAEAIALFSEHSHIVSDRLHAHILACLMDKPSTVLDNSYGKNSRYVRSWTLGSPLVHLREAAAA